MHEGIALVHERTLHEPDKCSGSSGGDSSPPIAKRVVDEADAVAKLEGLPEFNVGEEEAASACSDPVAVASN